jgi:predicted small lipoprotein YifL
VTAVRSAPLRFAACAVVVAVAVVSLVAACGARSELELPPSANAGADASPAADANGIAPPDASADAPPPPPPPPTCAGGVVVDSAQNPFYLALDATDVYFIDEGDPSVAADSSLRRCPKATGCAGTSTELLVGGRQFPGGLALDDAHVYWTELATGNAYACAKPSCNPVSLFTDPSDEPINVLADGALLDMLSYHAVETCPTTGCAAPQKLTQLTYGGLVVAADAEWIYFTVASPQGAPRGSVMACAKPACAGGPKVIATSLPGAPWGIAVDDTSIYFSIGGAAADPDGGGAIVRCPKSGCAGAPETLVAGRNHPTYLAADAQRVYWIEDGTAGKAFLDGAVAACSKSGCGGVARTIADHQYLPSAIAVDAGCVYWSTSADGNVHGTIQRAPTAGL